MKYAVYVLCFDGRRVEKVPAQFRTASEIAKMNADLARHGVKLLRWKEKEDVCANKSITS